MYCRKCGTQITEGMSFCTNCGERVAAPAVTIEEQTAQTTAQEMPREQPVPEAQPAAETTAAEQPEPQPTVQEIPAPPVQPLETGNTILPPIISAAKPEKIKTDFGKGALAFCLVIIGLLAISTGVYAGLYFSLI